LNAYPVVKFPNRTVYQYDVSHLVAMLLQLT
jgi:hypothetical protein